MTSFFKHLSFLQSSLAIRANTVSTERNPQKQRACSLEGCASSQPLRVLPEAHLSIILGFALGLPLAGAADAPLAESSTASLSFAHAWEQIQQHNPVLSAARSHVEAAGSATTKANTRPNPELSLEAENFGGSGPASGWDAAETTLLIHQPVETGGKRRARTAEAEAGKELSLAESEGCRLDLWVAFVDRYAEALQAREQEAIAEDNLRLIHELFLLVSQRVQAGKVAPLEASRAEVEFELAGIERDKARRQTLLAHRRLASLWGKSQPDFTALQGRLDSVQEWKHPAPNPEPRLSTPDLNRALKEQALQQAGLRRAAALAYPDVILSAGLRRFEENGDIAWVGGIALPLPLFDRNRAGIQQARHELSRADHLLQGVVLQQQLTLEELLVSAANDWGEIAGLRDKVLPNARDAMDKARIGYEQGKFSYLEWIDAERSYVTLRSRWITALTQYHKTLAALARLTGKISELSLFNQP